LRYQTETGVGNDFDDGTRWIGYPKISASQLRSGMRCEKGQQLARWIPFHAVRKHVEVRGNFSLALACGQREYREHRPSVCKIDVRMFQCRLGQHRLSDRRQPTTVRRRAKRGELSGCQLLDMTGFRIDYD